jgi:tetratricopeptide (TPR) repeat protein
MATISQALAMAIQHHNAGRLQAAEQIYRRILAVEPNHADAWHLLGLIAHRTGSHEVAAEYIGRAIRLHGNVAAYHYNLGNTFKDQGKLPEAVACYRRAGELEPDYVDAHNNLGAALRDLGKLDEAVACLRRVLELKPDYAAAHNNLANVLKDQKKLAEAVACYRRALELKPDFAEAHSNLGVALKEQGKLDEAVACYRRAVELKPDYVEALNNLGAALRDQGKPDEAVACLRRALQRNPDFTDAHNNLGNALKDQGKLDEAVACYRRVLELKPDFAEAYNNLGNALKEQRKLDEAVACYRRAMELKPDFAAAHNNLGMVLEERGEFQAAEDCFRAAIGHDPRFALAHYHLTELLGGKLPQQDLELLQRLLEETEITDAQRSLLHFGLARVLDARGQYAEAAAHLDRGNALQGSEWRKSGQDYDPNEHEFLVTQTIRVSTPDFFQGVCGFGSPSELPVFVVGLPRSGTTLIEQILASHSQVFGAGETTLTRDTMTALGGRNAEFIEGLSRLDRQTAVRLAARHLERLRGFSPAALRIVDKTPDNYLSLGLLASLFPRAKLVHCRRDPRDVAVSCWLAHFEEVRWASDQQHLASRFQQYQRIMEHWRKVLPSPLLEVDYEETVADLEGVARKLVAWCGLAWEPACLEFHKAKRPVRTASVVQVRQPVFSTSVGRWKHYQRALAPLFALLESVPGG